MNKNYIELLQTTARKFNSIVCLGLDPVIEDIPEKGTPKEQITTFYKRILDQLDAKKVYPSAVKPNYAFYAQYGIEGIEALVEVINDYKQAGFPVILDVKRGDIGKTARAYAKEAFSFFNADAVTLSPYMGLDSIQPFIDENPQAGYYILTKTSNKSSGDVQDILAGNQPVFNHVAKLILSWYHPGIGSVVGATYPQQLKDILTIYHESGKDIPLLIPGVGKQGGDLASVVASLREHSDIAIQRINSSSGINYAYKQYPDMHYADAAVKALDELNNAINL